MDHSRTLWMGNIEQHMDEEFIQELFKSISKIKIIIIYK